MMKNNIEFKIFSEAMDISLLRIAFKQINQSGIEIREESGEDFNLSDNSVAVICIKNLDEEIINKAYPFINDERTIIIVTDSEDIILASTLSRLGFKSIFVFPYELQKFKNYLNELIEMLMIKASKSLAESGASGFELLIGNSPIFQDTKSLAEKVSKNNDVGILILGETGTGKGLLAKAIHNNGSRAHKPFVDIICTAIPGTLLESELFGFEKGAFTDAKERKIGLMELAEDGTVFLDEIGDLSLDIQAKLLKALDNKVIRRLGSVNDIDIHARIIAATNRDLEKLVEQKQFRDDLYHRLNIITIKIPPLRERGKDVILLAEHFLQEATAKFKKQHLKMDRELKDFIQNYAWPGNVRELKNAIERAVLLSDSQLLKIDDFFSLPKGKSELKHHKDERVNLELNIEEHDLDSVAKVYAYEVYIKMNKNKSKTAQILGISRPKLDKLLNN